MNRRNFLQMCFGGVAVAGSGGLVVGQAASHTPAQQLVAPNYYGYRIKRDVPGGGVKWGQRWTGVTRRYIDLLKNGEVYNFPDHPLWDWNSYHCPLHSTWKLGWDKPKTDV